MKREVWSEKFSVWFRKVINEGGIVDFRYPVKGCGVWLPYGFKLRMGVISVIRKLLDETGHEECLFPIFVPENAFALEAAHIKGLETEVFWVTHAGARRLEERLVLRPTSETVVAPMLKLWIRSHADLPKKFYQIVNVFRYETKATWPIIRVREVTTFKEAHTSHSTFEEAEKQVQEGIEVYKSFFDNLCIPYVINKRPEWDKFPGALYSVAFETVMPDGKTLQIGTVHNLGQNFSRAFDLTFEKKDGSRDYVWQTCYGISERVIAAVIAVHGDDHGMVLPPTVAPIHVAIVPIPYKGFEDRVMEACNRVKKEIERDFKVHLDDRKDVTPGAKFYEMEMRGIPIRIEIGPKDVEDKAVTVVRRDTLERIRCDESSVKETVKTLLAEMEDSLRKRAWLLLKEHMYKAETIAEAVKLLKRKKGIVELNWCGSEECGVKIEKEVDGRLLGTPLDVDLIAAGKCVICSKDAKFIARVSKAY